MKHTMWWMLSIIMTALGCSMCTADHVRTYLGSSMLVPPWIRRTRADPLGANLLSRALLRTTSCPSVGGNLLGLRCRICNIDI